MARSDSNPRPQMIHFHSYVPISPLKKKRPKQRVALQTTWHQDVVPYPMPVCVISSKDADGRVNVASCSSVFPWCVSPESPQMVVVTRASSQTSTNIRETKEFCLNFMPGSSLEDVVATGRPTDAGHQKHEAIGLELEDAQSISVPRLVDAIWVAECTLAEVVYPTEAQNNLIADIHGLWIDERLPTLPKRRRLQATDTPVYFGCEEGNYFFTRVKRPHVFPALVKSRNTPLLEWAEDATEVMERVPALFRSTAKRAIEQTLHAEGKTHVTAADIRRLRPARRGGRGSE